MLPCYDYFGNFIFALIARTFSRNRLHEFLRKKSPFTDAMKGMGNIRSYVFADVENVRSTPVLEKHMGDIRFVKAERDTYQRA